MAAKPGRRSSRPVFALALCAALLLVRETAGGGGQTAEIVPWPDGVTTALRAIVVRQKERDPSVLAQLKSMGVNTLVTETNPDLATARAAAEAGLSYIAFLTTRDLERLGSDPLACREIGGMPSLSGFYFWDADILEGYTSPAAQERAYTSLKSLFPHKLVLFPTRLDPVETDPGFLDGYFRPGFSDLVTPYFYPVGGTVLGSYAEQDAWEANLEKLLSRVAERMPAGKGVLPVLQGFEQVGYPVGLDFPARQLAVYHRLWPENRNAAAFSWDGLEDTLVPMERLIALRQGFEAIFAPRERPAIPDQRVREPRSRLFAGTAWRRPAGRG